MGASRRVLLGGAAVLAVAVVVAAVALWPRGGEPTPEDAASRFLAAWDGGDQAALADLVDDPAALSQLTAQVDEDLGLTARRHELVAVAEEGDGARVTARASFEVGGFGAWDFDTAFELRPTDGGWAVVWSPAVLHPDLVAGAELALDERWPARAPILGVGGRALSGGAPGVLVGIEPRRMADRAAVHAALQAHLGVAPATVDAALAAPGVQPDHFVPVVEVPRTTYDQVRSAIYPVPGLVFRETTVRATPSPTFARHVVGRTAEVTAEQLAELGPPYRVGDVVGRDGLEAQHEQQLAGSPDGLVQLEVEGAAPRTLHTFPGRAPQPVQTTLDVDVQLAAEAALPASAGPSALVAVDRAGAVRAVVSRPLDVEFNRALSGQYPPGSTFKVVTATALLDGGLTPEAPVPCEPTVVVGGRSFRNFEGGASGVEPFSAAFARSCNTAIISAAQGMAPGALAAAAEGYGFNATYDIGVPSSGGSFPPPADPVEAAAAAIGQGGVTASPLHLASMAAAVDGGAWVAPHLVDGSAEGPAPRPLQPATRATLDRLMSLVVTEGTGTALAGVPGARGKSGTAEHGSGDPPPTHAWFVAYRGDLAVAVLVEGGQAGGTVAAPVAARFLAALPG